MPAKMGRPPSTTSSVSRMDWIRRNSTLTTLICRIMRTWPAWIAPPFSRMASGTSWTAKLTSESRTTSKSLGTLSFWTGNRCSTEIKERGMVSGFHTQKWVSKSRYFTCKLPENEGKEHIFSISRKIVRKFSYALKFSVRHKYRDSDSTTVRCIAVRILCAQFAHKLMASSFLFKTNAKLALSAVWQWRENDAVDQSDSRTSHFLISGCDAYSEDEWKCALSLQLLGLLNGASHNHKWHQLTERLEKRSRIL